MLHLLKPFEGKDTVSFEKRLNHSLVLLTLFYTLTLGLMLLISGYITYSAFSSRIGERFNRIPVPGNNLQIEIRRGPTVEEVRQDLITSLILVNEILLVIAIIISYLLARMSLKPLKRAYEEQRRFIADASHELRTPLTILHMDLENELQNKSLNEEEKEKVQSSLEEVQRMTKIVNDLLLLSKLENQEIKIELVALDLNESIIKSIQRLGQFASSHKVSLEFEEHKEPVMIKGNEEMLSHIFTNFIKNAIQYNNENGKVNITIDVDRSYAKVNIQDNGIGINADDLKHIFDRFYRTDKSRSRGTGGSGLGLSIAERSVRSLGGTLNIESEIEEGTKVIISFPKI